MIGNKGKMSRCSPTLATEVVPVYKGTISLLGLSYPVSILLMLNKILQRTMLATHALPSKQGFLFKPQYGFKKKSYGSCTISLTTSVKHQMPSNSFYIPGSLKSV